MIDYESQLFIGNAGMSLWIIWAHLALTVILFITYKVKFLRQRIGKYLFWNTLIRLLIEVYFEILLMAALNAHIADWSSPFPAVMFSNVLSVVVLVTVAVTPFIIMLFFYKRQDKWTDKDFDEKYGGLIEGTRVQSKTVSKGAILAYLLTYFARRGIFTFSVFILSDYLWLQLAIQMICSLCVLSILLYVRPFSDPRLQRLEVFNEITILGLSYMLAAFSDMITDPGDRYNYGWLYLALSLLNIATHVLLLLYDTIKKIIRKIKQRFYKKKMQAILKTRS